MFIQKYHKNLAPKFRPYLKLQAHIYVAADVLQSKKNEHTSVDIHLMLHSKTLGCKISRHH